MATTPLDLTALARDHVAWICTNLVGLRAEEKRRITERLKELLTQSHTAGRAEGLKVAALTADCFNCGVCGMDGKAGAAIRALL